MPDRLPFISVVIPTYNRPVILGPCLEALALQDYPADCYEVIVVDDGSTVPMQEAIDAFQDRLDISLIRQKNAGPGAARNTGAAQARGELLAFTDDDCRPDKGWLRAFSTRFYAQSGADILMGGRVVNALSENRYAEAAQLVSNYLYTYYNADPQAAVFFTTNNMAVPREAFHAVGGFDTTYIRYTSEDRELCDRWRFLGRMLHYVPEALVHHVHDLSFRDLIRQHFAYGRGAVHYYRARTARGQPDLKIEPFAFYRGMLRFPFTRGHGPVSGLLQAGLMGITQGVLAAGYFWEKRL